MKVTESEMKCRQLHKEGQPQRVSAEQKEYVVAHDSQRITENNLVNRYLGKEDLLESILTKDNIEAAVKRVKRNKGASGIDGIEVTEIGTYLEKNWANLKEQILCGKYRPQAVRRVEIPKEEKGKVRKLGIPTAQYLVVVLVIKSLKRLVTYSFMIISKR